MRNCNQCFNFFSLKKHVLSQKKGLQKRGDFSAFPSKWFFLKNWSQNHKTYCRSSRQEVFCKKSVLRNLAKFTGINLWQSLFFNKVAGLIKKETRAQVVCYEFCQFLRTAFLVGHLRWLLLTLEFLEIVFSFMGSPNLQL